MNEKRAIATVQIEEISPAFVGYEIEPELVVFNLKSTLAQLGLNGIGSDFYFERSKHTAQLKVELVGIGYLGIAMLGLLTVGAYIGKIFAADERRRVRDRIGKAVPSSRWGDLRGAAP